MLRAMKWAVKVATAPSASLLGMVRDWRSMQWWRLQQRHLAAQSLRDIRGRHVDRGACNSRWENLYHHIWSLANEANHELAARRQAFFSRSFSDWQELFSHPEILMFLKGSLDLILVFS